MVNTKNLIMIYAFIATFLYLTGVFSLLVLVPFIVAYYLYGIRFCKKSAFLFFFIIAITRIVIMIFFEKSFSANTDTETYFSDNSSPYNSLYILIYELLYLLGAIVSILILLHSHFAWLPRIIVATAVFFISVYLKNIYLQAHMANFLGYLYELFHDSPSFTSVFQNVYSDIGNTGNAKSDFFALMEKIFSFVMLFQWATVIIVVLINWLVGVIITQRFLRFNLHRYLLHVYVNIQQYYSQKLLFFLFLSGSLLFLLKNTQNAFLAHVHVISSNVFIMLLFCCMIYGIVTWYFMINARFSRTTSYFTRFLLVKRNSSDSMPNDNILVRSDWYLFIVCAMMIVPFISFIVLIYTIALGIKKNIQYNIKNNISRSNNESNS